MIREIVNVNESWGIGSGGDMLLFLPEDMKYFRQKTKEAVVIMGRSTLESFPRMAPLKNRINIVLTGNVSNIRPECFSEAEEAAKRGEETRLVIVSSLEDALSEAAKYPEKEIYVIGGGMIYNQFLPYCDECLVTVNDFQAEADTWFPNLSELADWYEADAGEPQVSETGVHYRFTVWKRIKTDQE